MSKDNWGLLAVNIYSKHASLKKEKLYYTIGWIDELIRPKELLYFHTGLLPLETNVDLIDTNQSKVKEIRPEAALRY